MSVTLNSWSTGAKALEWLSGGAGPSVVANVFPNSFYLRTSTSELISVTRKGVRSPVNVNVETAGPSFDRTVNVGETTTFDAGVLSLRGLKIHLSDHLFANAFVPHPGSERLVFGLKEELSAAASMLRVFDLPESILDSDGKAFSSYRSFVGAVVRSPFDEASFLKKGYDLLGLGSGFTPSFDDFMAGFLCMYNAGNALFRRSPVYLDMGEARKRTSWASSRLLDYMQHGLMDEVVESVVSSFFRGDAGAYINSLQDVVARGHSSGLDMSAGMVLASATIIDLMDHGSLAERVSKSLGF